MDVLHEGNWVPVKQAFKVESFRPGLLVNGPLGGVEGVSGGVLGFVTCLGGRFQGVGLVMLVCGDQFRLSALHAELNTKGKECACYDYRLCRFWVEQLC